jgi:hypothetical protein
MGIESLHRIWPRRATRWWHRLAGVAERGAGSEAAPAHRALRGIDFDEAQAQALCELVADPSSGITRVTVVGAGPRLLDAIEDVATDCGVALEEARRNGARSGSARLIGTGAEGTGHTREAHP